MEPATWDAPVRTLALRRYRNSFARALLLIPSRSGCFTSLFWIALTLARLPTLAANSGHVVTYSLRGAAHAAILLCLFHGRVSRRTCSYSSQDIPQQARAIGLMACAFPAPGFCSSCWRIKLLSLESVVIARLLIRWTASYAKPLCMSSISSRLTEYGMRSPESLCSLCAPAPQE